MRLKITAPDGGFKTGNAARLFLDDVEVSEYVSRVELYVDAEDAIRAEVTFFLTEVDVDVPVVITPLISDAKKSHVLGLGPSRSRGRGELIEAT